MGKYDKLKQLMEVSRYKPVIGAEKLLGIDLPDYQRDMLNRIWNNKRVVLLCSRRTGKTFVSAVALSLKAILYPQMRIGIVAPVFRQAQTVFYEVENIYDNSYFFRLQCKSEPKHRTSGWRLPFLNSSLITAVPLSDNIRSKGYNIAMIDEYSFGDDMENKVKRIIRPMLFTKRSAKVNDTHSTDIGNQIIQASTATFKWNDFYDLVQTYEEKIKKGKDNYDIISYDYRDGLRSGIFEEETVLEDYENADSLTRQMEFLNVFPDESGGFITYKLLNDKAFDTDEVYDEDSDKYEAPETQVELEQTDFDKNGYPENQFVLSLDDADQGTDNFAAAVLKLDGNVKRLVRLEVLGEKDTIIKDKIELIRKLLKKYNIVLIVADQRHKSIKDGLAEPYTYPDGSTGQIIADMDDEDQLARLRRDYGTDVNMREILKIHSFTSKTNEERARHFLTEIEKGRFKIPVDPKGGYESKKEEDIYNEIKEAVVEIVSIKPQAGGRYTRYQPEGSGKKDRWTVCELGCYMADQYLRDDNSNDEFVVCV